MGGTEYCSTLLMISRTAGYPVPIRSVLHSLFVCRFIYDIYSRKRGVLSIVLLYIPFSYICSCRFIYFLSCLPVHFFQGLDEVQQEADPARVHVEGRLPAGSGRRGRAQAALHAHRGVEDKALPGPRLWRYVFQCSGTKKRLP